MASIVQSVSIAANATNENVIAGSQFEYMPRNAYLEIGLNGSATGLVSDVYSGLDILAENMALTAQNRIPVYPDDFGLQDVIGAGERLKIRIRNTTAGALTAFYAVRMSPV